ncbi:myosin-14-like [Macrobrachium rosenbergii]|uniref:myosin-14-like n=1 Tax=Macrobrachium rosenbergii TaxID=79674 RepID=UPI0034D6B743
MTMKTATSLLTCFFLWMALCHLGAKAASLHARRHPRTRGHVARLQDTVDQLLLRQKTDHILLNNLQKAVQELQNRRMGEASEEGGDGGSRLPKTSRVLASVEAEGLVLSALGDRMKEMRGTLTEALEAEERQDDITILRQELAYLRSEVQRLKSARATESEASAAQVKAHEQREAVTATWVADNIKRLQDSVVDLQQSLNVTQAMHDKQEVESRLLTVTKDVLALRGTMAGVTSKAEAAAATSKTLQEDLARNSEDLHHAMGQVAAVRTEVTSLREDFNDLLTALPEGTMAGAPSEGQSKEKAPVKSKGRISAGIAEVVGKAAQARLIDRIASLENKADQLDFALSHTQKQLSLIAPVSNNDERLAELTESERQLETRVEAAATGLGEVKTSSVQLLAALDALEARVEKGISEVKQEVAKLEFTVAQSSAERKNQEKDDQTVHDDTEALRADLQVVSKHLDQLVLKTAHLEGQRLEAEVSEAQCRTQHLTLDIKLNDILDRLTSVEEHFEKSTSHRRRTQHGDEGRRSKRSSRPPSS